MKYKIILLFIIISFSLKAQRVLSLEQAIDLALSNNNEIQISKLNVKKADAAVSEAFGYALPDINLSLNFSHYLEKPKMAFPDFEALLTNAAYGILFNENVIPEDNSKFLPMDSKLQSFVQTNNFETNITLTQTLFNSAVLRGIGASKIYSDLSKEDLKRVTAATILNVKKAFYGVLLTKQLLQITHDSYLNANENLRNVRAVFDQGMVSEFDRLQAEVRVENINPVILQMSNSLESAKEGLKMLLGIRVSEEIDVTGDLVYEPEFIPAIEDIVIDAVKDNPTLQTLRVKRNVDKEFIELDRSEYWPTVYGFASYSFSGSSENLKFSNYNAAIVGLGLSINLFTGMKTKNRVQQSEISLKQTDWQINQLENFISSSVKTKLSELNRVKGIIEAQERNVNLAQRAYEISLVRYREGSGSQLEVENSDLALKQAKINKTNSVFDYLIAKAELEELLGRENPENIQKIFSDLKNN
jgi:outer membrane protein